MFGKSNYSDWENLVKKQLKTDDVFSVLNKENLEGISVKPYYADAGQPLQPLPRAEESTHLVAKYRDGLEEDVFAFLVNSSPDVSEKAIFVSQDFIEDDFYFNSENRYFSLIDIFNDLGENVGHFEYNSNKNFGERLLTMPFQKCICVDVSAHQNAGAAIYQQLGIALAKAKELVEIFGEGIFKKIIVKIAIGGQYFFEISKIRALKILFNQLSNEYGLDEVPFIFAETTLRNKAKNDPENNLIRSTLELSAAMVGGADAVFSNDFKIGDPSVLSEEISFKQQIVLAYESIINVFDDAANGSYFVEDITQQLCKKSWDFFLEIEDNGGYLNLLNQGIIQKKIYNQAVSEQKWVEEGKIKLIGTNLYPKLEQTKSAYELYSEKQIKPVRWAQMFE